MGYIFFSCEQGWGFPPPPVVLSGGWVRTPTRPLAETLDIIVFRTSDFGHDTSGFGQQTLEFGHQTWNNKF